MKNTIKFAVLSCVAALTLGAAPFAQAVTVASSAPTSASAAGGTSTTLTKQQLKAQKKLRKKCAKLSSGKLSAKKRAKFAAMCKTTAGTTEDSTKPVSVPGSTGSAGGSGPVIELIQNSPVLFVPTITGTEKTDGETSSTLPTDEIETTPMPEPGSLAPLGLGPVGPGLARPRARR